MEKGIFKETGVEYTIHDLKHLYYEDKTEFEKINKNLVCPTCKKGNVFSAHNKNVFFLKTIHKTHDVECDEYKEPLSKKVSKECFESNAEGNIRVMEKLLIDLMSSSLSPKKGNDHKDNGLGFDANPSQRPVKEVNTVRTLNKRKLNLFTEEDLDIYKIFYGKVTLERLENRSSDNFKVYKLVDDASGKIFHLSIGSYAKKLFSKDFPNGSYSVVFMGIFNEWYDKRQITISKDNSFMFEEIES